MAKRIIKEFKVGDLVVWFEPYADGLLTKDAGKGIVLQKKIYDLGFSSGPSVTYKVYRNKHQDTMIFEPRELEIINEQ
jgi:hypothetical protein